MELFLGILAAVALSLVIMAFQRKRTKAAWQGVVTRIKEETDVYDDENNFREGQILIHYRTDSGKKGKIRLSRHHFGTMFQGLKAGDRLEKQAGEPLPRWVQGE